MQEKQAEKYCASKTPPVKADSQQQGRRGRRARTLTSRLKTPTNLTHLSLKFT
jgi:hypothetical protein